MVLLLCFKVKICKFVKILRFLCVVFGDMLNVEVIVVLDFNFFLIL